MREELDAKLVEKYPQIFKNRYAPMNETAMCWGFDCGDGWYTILDVLCGMITSDYRNAKQRYEYIKECFDKHGKYPWENGKTITAEEVEVQRIRMEEECQKVPVAMQVKEKFGGLRFYVDRASEENYNYINFAECLSHQTCEECGAPGQTYTLGWHRTLCDKHADENYGEEAAHYRNKTGEWSDDEE